MSIEQLHSYLIKFHWNVTLLTHESDLHTVQFQKINPTKSTSTVQHFFTKSLIVRCLFWLGRGVEAD